MIKPTLQFQDLSDFHCPFGLTIGSARSQDKEWTFYGLVIYFGFGTLWLGWDFK